MASLTCRVALGICVASTLAACGGRVVIDGSGGGGSVEGEGVVTFVSGQTNPLRIAVHHGSVYWLDVLNNADGTRAGLIQRASVNTGWPVEVASSPIYVPSMTLDGPFLFWGDKKGTVHRTPEGGGAGETFFKSSGFVSALHADGTDLYTSIGGSLFRIPLKAPAEAVALPGNVSAEALTTDATDIYWSNPERVMRMSKSGSAPIEIYATEVADPVPDVQGINGLAQDQDNLYFSDTGFVLSLPKKGGPPKVLTPELQAMVGPIAVDTTWVYWAEPASGRVMKVDKDGGEPVEIAVGQDRPQGMALGEEHVFWTNTFGGTIMRAPR